MDIISAARALGEAIQHDARYLAYKHAKEVNDADGALNELIGRLNLIQMNYQNESAKENPDDSRLKEMDAEFNEVYGQVMLNENMRSYEEAKNEVDEMMNYLIGILTLCVNGADPATCEPEAAEAHSCSGSCSSCSGCC